jgi:hypothetical protein
MADEVNAEAERAADAARAAVKRANPSSSSLLPLIVVAFAVVTAAALLLMDSEGPQTQPRADGPTTTRPNN